MSSEKNSGAHVVLMVCTEFYSSRTWDNPQKSFRNKTKDNCIK